ncbi:hypothetical protein FQN50_010008 [Emmonsiellopsis sp. PD_5]|nr:hypothetical protein FQN50_010008 [Emmonsiellopsis sp. PD_5]
MGLPYLSDANHTPLGQHQPLLANATEDHDADFTLPADIGPNHQSSPVHMDNMGLQCLTEANCTPLGQRRPPLANATENHDAGFPLPTDIDSNHQSSPVHTDNTGLQCLTEANCTPLGQRQPLLANATENHDAGFPLPTDIDSVHQSSSVPTNNMGSQCLSGANQTLLGQRRLHLATPVFPLSAGIPEQGPQVKRIWGKARCSRGGGYNSISRQSRAEYNQKHLELNHQHRHDMEEWKKYLYGGTMEEKEFLTRVKVFREAHPPGELLPRP